MVNIPLVTMDDYGLLEPTDVGTMTIDNDSKDDSKRKISRWDQEEVVYMLKLMKERSFVGKYSVTKMSPVLSQLMQKKGYKRTDKQIQVKLTMLRKNYLTFEKQKALNINPKECPFYKELKEVYHDASSTNGYESDEDDTNGQEDCLIRFPNDPIEWTREEIQKMLNLIKSMKLKNELSLTFFSPVALRMVAESMMAAGYDRSTQQVKNALSNLRTLYVDYKVGCDSNENPEECIFFSCLDFFWGRDYKKCRIKDKKKSKPDDAWTTEETIVLLTLIQDLNIVEESYKNTDKAAEELRLSLNENGYVRTKQQVITRLIQLKMNFINVHTSNCEEGTAVNKFPFYNLYKKLFEKQYSQEIRDQSNHSSDSRKDSLEYADFCANIKETSQRNVHWADEEVKLLLRTIQKITSQSQFNNSLEDEKLQKLVDVLREADYHKTADQIKRKITLLKDSYQKCNSEGSSEKDIFNCPYYNELHKIFHTPVSDARYEFIQNLLAENLDLSTSKFSDHSYTNVRCGNGCEENRSNDKVTVVPNKSLDTWYPVESIIDDDGISPSTTLGLNNISAISNKEHEQVVEDVILATLPNSSDKLDINHTIAEDTSFSNVDPSNDGPIPPSILNDIAIEQEVETTNEENNVDCGKIYYYERPASQMSVDQTTCLQADTPNCEEDGPPPNKKPRIIEDERIGKNKILLRPVDGNSSSLNISKPTSKFVRLIVANDRPSKSNFSHITAHIEPLSVNAAAAASSVASSGLSSPVDRVDAARIASEKALKEDLIAQRLEAEIKSRGSNTESCGTSSNHNFDAGAEKITQTIKDAMQTMMNHDEVMQQRHQAWMEKQFEIQRKHEDEQKNVLVKELQELRKCIAVLLASKQPHANSQHR